MILNKGVKPEVFLQPVIGPACPDIKPAMWFLGSTTTADQFAIDITHKFKFH